jgi:ubiquinone/menaquinone biosynthesis C-methylase UbiE
MEVSEAKHFIQAGLPENRKSTWADLGCGSGTFTYALAGLLAEGSKIIAVDKSVQNLKNSTDGCHIEFIKSNFESEDLPFKNVDGILMANALHYIQDQASFIKKMRKNLVAEGKIILIEYDTEESNQWVPFPVSLERATGLFKNAGFTEIQKLGEKQSIYRNNNLYAISII